MQKTADFHLRACSRPHRRVHEAKKNNTKKKESEEWRVNPFAAAGARGGTVQRRDTETKDSRLKINNR